MSVAAHLRVDLTGRVAIVTGAARGIGRATAESLAESGCKVVAADIDEAALDHFAAPNSPIVPVVVDIARLDGLDQMVRVCRESFGKIDILVNNAGLLDTAPIEEVTESDWDRIMAVNLKGAFFAAQRVLPSMRERGWGRIINISSLAGRNGGFANGLAYAASKAGIIGMSRGMASRVARDGITVNSIAPGTTESDMVAAFDEQKKRDLRARIPIGRLGSVQDIADLALFLASEHAGFITGAVVDINGGMFIG